LLGEDTGLVWEKLYTTNTVEEVRFKDLSGTTGKVQIDIVFPPTPSSPEG
jgi:hypothetical protein